MVVVPSKSADKHFVGGKSQDDVYFVGAGESTVNERSLTEMNIQGFKKPVYWRYASCSSGLCAAVIIVYGMMKHRTTYVMPDLPDKKRLGLRQAAGADGSPSRSIPTEKNFRRGKEAV